MHFLGFIVDVIKAIQEIDNRECTQAFQTSTRASFAWSRGRAFPRKFDIERRLHTISCQDPKFFVNSNQGEKGGFNLSKCAFWRCGRIYRALGGAPALTIFGNEMPAFVPG